ncbi:hypothetical protein LXT21_32830 [Myxococcus sp. K38C18041901]|uniref:hypothetical protein n=1 Tax=Myxococcus guangdongensis TaxID=2906760 RepID=UPI0020A73CB9|nr:hypothetical protein [Myxococcus guangdongensis]MCP3063571.1 hypothetical protein [Myxococcus guangdongensis]
MLQRRVVSLMATRASRGGKGAVRPVCRNPEEASTALEGGGAPPLLCPFWFNLGPQVAANDSESPSRGKRRRKGGSSES